MRGVLNRAGRGSAALLALSMVLAVPGVASAARTVYVSNGLGGSQNLSALAIAANGSLTPVAGSPFATGASTQEGLSITPNAQNLYVSSFGTGDIRGFSVLSGGGLSAVPGSPFATGSTPLGNAPAPDGSRLYVWNHGNAVGVWSIVAGGTISQIPGSPFPVSAGHTNPFAASVAPSGNFLYVPDENPNPSTVTVYSVSPGGSLNIVQTVPTGHNPFGSAITPDGKFFYVSAPEADPGFPNGSIIMYAVNPATGLLTEIGTRVNPAPGNHPLEMAISPDSKHLYVATRITSTVNAYTINADGRLVPVPGQPFATGGTNGKSLALTPDGKRLYVANQGSNNVSGFDVASDGSLSSIPGSPWLTGGTSPDLESIAITPNQAPTASFTAAAAPTGNASQFNGAASTDSDGTVASYTWDFGDGSAPTTTTTPSIQHSYTNPGAYTAKLTVTDNEGCSAQRIFTGEATLCNGLPSATTTRPVTVSASAKLSNLKISPNALVAADHGASIATTGAKVSYHDTLAWTTTFVVQQAKPGIKQAGTCVKPPKPSSPGQKCTRFVKVGSFTHKDHAGNNSFHFTGRVANHRLADGSYRLEATPMLGTFVGNTLRVGFHVVTPRSAPSAPPSAPPTPRALARISALRIGPRAFAPDSRGASITQARRRKTGSRINYNDSQAATTTFTVLRVVTGVKRGRRCVGAPRNRKIPKGRRCTRLVRVGAFSHHDHRGANSLHFSGRVSGRKLAVGRYRLQARPRFAGRNGNTATIRFTITK